MEILKFTSYRVVLMVYYPMKYDKDIALCPLMYLIELLVDKRKNSCQSLSYKSNYTYNTMLLNMAVTGLELFFANEEPKIYSK